MAIGKLFNWLRRTPETAPIPDAVWTDTMAALPFLDRPFLLPPSLQASSTSPAVLDPSTRQRIQCHLRSW